jgi:hypothetical protein
MRIWIIRGLMLWVGAALSLAVPAQAQNREKAWELMPYVGHIQFSDDVGLKDDVSWGFRFGYHWTKRHMVEFGFNASSTEDSSTGELSADLLGANVNYLLNFFLHRRDKVVAFVTAGFGVQSFSTFGFVSDPELVGDENDLSYNYGAGIRFFGGERLGIRIDARQLRFSSDAGGTQDYIEYAVGLSIVLGGA